MKTLLIMAVSLIMTWSFGMAGGSTVREPNTENTQGDILVLDAPSNLGLRPLRDNHVPGVWRLSSALRAHGLMLIPGTQDVGTVPAPAYDPNKGPTYDFRHGQELRDYSIRLADKIDSLLDRDTFMLLLGGDCSILVGTGLALKRNGRYGLIFIDGHTDFPFPQRPRQFAKHGLTAAGLDLGLVTGYGPGHLSNIEGKAPYFKEDDVVAFGYRYVGDSSVHRLEDWEQSEIAKQPLDKVREIGVEAAVNATLAHLEEKALEGVWIHLDADVIDPDLMPAVDSPEDKGGMTFDELEHALSLLIQSDQVVGLQFTIFDPDLDPGGKLAKQWVGLLSRVLAKKHPRDAE